MESVEASSMAGGTALLHVYGRVRAEVRGALTLDLHDEFDRVFPPDDQLISMNQTAMANHARATMGSLAGWIEGMVTASQAAERLKAEAEAYAVERVKNERGVGFQP